MRDMVAFRLNYRYSPQDFSLGKLFKGQSIVDVNGQLDGAKLSTLRSHIEERARMVNAGLAEATSLDALDALVTEAQAAVVGALANQDGWRSLFPGRRLLEEYAPAEGLGQPIVLQNSVIKHLGSSKGTVPTELVKIIDRVVAAGG
jgi:hypothetical protein